MDHPHGSGMIRHPLVSLSAAGSVAASDVVATTLGSRYPKRKRTRVSYCELDIGDSETDSEDDEDKCAPPKKRAKLEVIRSRRPLPRHKIFPFMRLPAELRNKIYHECLVSDELDDADHPSFYFLASKRGHRHTVDRCTRENAGASHYYNLYHRYNKQPFHRQSGDSSETSLVKSLAVNLLATCKAIYAEAAPLLYHQRFVFCDTMALMNFMSECTPQTAEHIRHIDILRWLQTRSRKNVGFLAISMLAAKGAVNLQSLRVAGSLGYFSPSHWRDQRRCMTVHDRVARKVYKDFYPWLEAVGRTSGNMYQALAVLDIGHATWARSTYKWDEDERGNIKAPYEKALKKLIGKSCR